MIYLDGTYKKAYRINNTLYSYGTKILTLNKDGSICKHWSGYSLTTMRHICQFLGYKMTKKEWEAIECRN